MNNLKEQDEKQLVFDDRSKFVTIISLCGSVLPI